MAEDVKTELSSGTLTIIFLGDFCRYCVLTHFFKILKKLKNSALFFSSFNPSSSLQSVAEQMMGNSFSA